MEPWKRRCTLRWRRCFFCFNGATAMEPWKSCGPAATPLTTVRLQWGHGDGAVEEVETVAPNGFG